jgi:hypothetical protein
MKLAKPEKKITYIGMLIDDSASMASVRQPTLSGFNEQIQYIKTMVAPDHEVYLTTAIFSEPGKFKVLRLFVDPTTVEALGESEYTTSGGSTALLDAMDQLIRVMEEKNALIKEGKNAALVQFFTDGQENSSCVIKDRNLIKSRIEELTKTGHWTFTYMGVGSIEDISQGYGLSVNNITQFKHGVAGAVANSFTNTAALMSYNSARGAGATTSASLYNPTNDEEDDKLVKP